MTESLVAAKAFSILTLTFSHVVWGLIDRWMGGIKMNPHYSGNLASDTPDSF